MKKSKTSMLSLFCGLTTTSLAILLFPLAIIGGKSHNYTLIGILAIFTISVGLLGTVLSSAKLLSGEAVTDEEKADRSVAVKGFWFSIAPTIFWIFIGILGSTT